MRSGLGGHETLNLYAEAIAKMPENPGIPLLFRDIFKNAYLPYRDPETLKMFLKVIDEFNYDHSERLGDAFEYLLSVLGSQGEAGQFRTPRHIIDFMVAVIDPKKNETVLDPACGTAGFLISSYKHILKVNTDAKGNSTLTPDEKGRLAQNFKGYDISPDMVRLSLVNLYLHGFADPHIFEYDTLTSQDRWNEYADVILANPPFMSPKGGIKPHNRFSVQSKRSEVLFVDYMAEHLTPGGRAGIIVPEGIIFQSQTAYKQLRKMLVEEYLVAVVSLPAGVFNPYSGVKTSILILDKSLAKKTGTMAFFKIENDGFGLGAQRRKIDKNDLPAATDFLKSWLQFIRSTSSTAPIPSTLNCLIVEKEKIAANGEYNLSGERYRENGTVSSRHPFVALGNVCEIYQPKTITQQDLKEDGVYLVYGANGVIGRFDQFNHEFPEVIVTCRGATCGTVNYSKAKSWITGNAMVFALKTEAILKDYLFQILKHSDLSSTISGSAQPQITRQSIAPYEIPLPPLEVQKEIVAEIEGYQKVVNGARTVLDHYRPHIPIHPDWPMVPLGDICSLGGTITTDVNLALPYIGADSIESNTGKLLKTETAQSQRVNGPVYEFAGERLLYSKIRPYLNKLTVVDLRGYCSSDMYPLLPDSAKVQITYLATYMLSDTFNERIRGYYERASIPKINRSQLFETEIPLPPLATQQSMVAEIEAEQALVNANRDLIARFEKKIQATLARVWGEDEPAPADRVPLPLI
jgi:type I restriction enzyme M protein